MVDWSKTAFVFPGQGSQVVGMGQDFADSYAVAHETYAQADALLGYRLSEIMFSGPADALDDTLNTQPAMYVNSIAILRVLQQELPAAQPAFVAGHSLGELTALSAAGALAFDAGVPLVHERARLMQEAGKLHSGGMAAILGLTPEQVREICKQASAQTGEPLVLANDNCPGQIVISGDKATLDVALELAKAAKARRAIPLKVSVAPHSPLMAPAEADFTKAVEKTRFEPPSIPVYANISAQPLRDVPSIRRELEAQLTNPVHWTDSVQNMIAAGVETFIELGSKDVLTGLLRRIDKTKTGLTLHSVEALQAFVAENA